MLHFSSRPSPKSSTPALLDTAVRPLAPCPQQQQHNSTPSQTSGTRTHSSTTTQQLRGLKHDREKNVHIRQRNTAQQLQTMTARETTSWCGEGRAGEHSETQPSRPDHLRWQHQLGTDHTCPKCPPPSSLPHRTCFRSASMRNSGMPHRPNPPTKLFRAAPESTDRTQGRQALTTASKQGTTQQATRCRCTRAAAVRHWRTANCGLSVTACTTYRLAPERPKPGEEGAKGRRRNVTLPQKVPPQPRTAQVSNTHGAAVLDVCHRLIR